MGILCLDKIPLVPQEVKMTGLVGQIWIKSLARQAYRGLVVGKEALDLHAIPGLDGLENLEQRVLVRTVQQGRV